MPTPIEFQGAVRASLKESSGVITFAIAEKAKGILRNFVAISRHKIPQPNLAQVLINIFTQKIALITSSDHAPHEIHQHQELQKRLRALKTPDDEAEISTIRSQMKVALGPKQMQWFQLELAELIFTELTLNLNTTNDVLWADSFIKLPPEGVACLIQQICYEIIETDWQASVKDSSFSLFSWLKEQAAIAEKHNLFKLGEILSDPVLLNGIPDTPIFCLRSNNSWCILDNSTIEGSLQANEDYRQTLAQIENSGPTGIGYLIESLSPETQALNNVLVTWFNYFPTDLYAVEYENGAETDMMRQVFIGAHDQWIDSADECLDLAVSIALSEETCQIPRIEAQLEQRKIRLLELDALEKSLAEAVARRLQIQKEKAEILVNAELSPEEKEDYLELKDFELLENKEDMEHCGRQIAGEFSQTIAEEISELTGQLIQLVARLKEDALFQIDLACELEEKETAAILLNHNLESESCVLSDEQLSCLIAQAVDDLIARKFEPKDVDHRGPLGRHLDLYREKQEERAFKCRESLRTAKNLDDECWDITPDRIRDPIDRRCYIDVATKTDGRDFCDIIIGGCLLAKEAYPFLPLPENVEQYLKEQESNYPDIAKQKFNLFRKSELELTADQQKILEPYLISARYDLLATRGHFAVKAGSPPPPAPDSAARATIRSYSC